MEFTYDAYKNLIRVLKKNKYVITDYHNYQNTEYPCILRHDIDYSLEKAVRFAQMEASMGVRSTYFVMITSQFYNVLSAGARKSLRQLTACGHEIGLHYDETAYEQCGKETWIRTILYEKDLLEYACEKNVSVVSMHRPSKEMLKEDLNIPEMVNSYSKKFFTDFKYVSDSRMNWREDVELYVKRRLYQCMHILTHAFWYEETVHDIRSSLTVFLDEARKERYDTLQSNFTDLSKVLGKKERRLR